MVGHWLSMLCESEVLRRLKRGCEGWIKMKSHERRWMVMDLERERLERTTTLIRKRTKKIIGAQSVGERDRKRPIHL